MLLNCTLKPLTQFCDNVQNAFAYPSKEIPMSNRTILYLTIVVLIGMGIILAINTASTLGLSGRYISINDVRGMAIEARGKAWTLNYDQQKEVLDILNAAKPLQPSYPGSKGPDFLAHADFNRLTIYRFDEKPDLIITPIGYTSDNTPGAENLEFSIPSWNPSGPLRESSNGKLKSILESLYDHY